MTMTTARNALSSLAWGIHMRRAAILSLSVLTLLLSWPRPAAAVPAFARKYGVRCTVCHEAWPVLNDFGRAFRDNGYRMNLGKDEPSVTDPAYWPVYAVAEPHFGFDLVKSHTGGADTTLQKNGQFQTGLAVLGAIGTLGDHASFLVIPVAAINGLTLGFPTAEFRFNDLFDRLHDAGRVRAGRELFPESDQTGCAERFGPDPSLGLGRDHVRVLTLMRRE
jgi:hypothetical protein